MVNALHDTGSYDCSCYRREIYDGNALYDAFLKAKRGSDWKPQVQRFEMTYLLELAAMQKELQNRTYKFLPSTQFTLRERGKIRAITGEQMKDRVAKHALCDEVITPAMRKYLIHDNGASLTGKGVSFTRKRLETHLHRYYQQYQTNEGYVLLMDFSKYYDNIWHEQLFSQLAQYTDNPTALWFLGEILDRAKVDVSYMTDEEYARCMTDTFNSLAYAEIDKSLLTGEKFMRKHLDIGNQVAQNAGIAYPIPIDNYIKIVKGVKFYGRYMDDSYVIHRDKAFLQDLLNEVIEIARGIGITVNVRKTRICKLSEMWRFLQIQYSLTETGRVVHKINPKRLTCMRRKMKKVVHVLDEKGFDDLYKAWFQNYYRLMSKQQRENMNTLYHNLKEEHYHVHTHSG